MVQKAYEAYVIRVIPSKTYGNAWSWYKRALQDLGYWDLGPMKLGYWDMGPLKLGYLGYWDPPYTPLLLEPLPVKTVKQIFIYRPFTQQKH